MTWNISDQAVLNAQSLGRDAASDCDDGLPLHVVREAIIQGFDERAKEILGE